jgi:hypothetical protein
VTSDKANPTETPYYPATVRGFRLLVDLLVVCGLAYWGLQVADGAIGVLLAIVLCAFACALWLLFGVPDDPLRDSFSVIRVNGSVRLLLELAIVGVAAFGVWIAGSRAAAETLLTAAGLCYGVTWERLVWLVRNSSDSDIT